MGVRLERCLQPAQLVTLAKSLLAQLRFVQGPRLFERAKSTLELGYPPNVVVELRCERLEELIMRAQLLERVLQFRLQRGASLPLTPAEL